MSAGIRTRLDRLEAQLGADDDRCPGCRQPISAIAYDSEADTQPKCGLCGVALAELPRGIVKVYVGCSPADWDRP